MRLLFALWSELPAQGIRLFLPDTWRHITRWWDSLRWGTHHRALAIHLYRTRVTLSAAPPFQPRCGPHPHGFPFPCHYSQLSHTSGLRSKALSDSHHLSDASDQTEAREQRHTLCDFSTLGKRYPTTRGDVLVDLFARCCSGARRSVFASWQQNPWRYREKKEEMVQLRVSGKHKTSAIVVMLHDQYFIERSFETYYLEIVFHLNFISKYSSSITHFFLYPQNIYFNIDLCLYFIKHLKLQIFMFYIISSKKRLHARWEICVHSV